MSDKECTPLHVLIVGASLRRESLNNRLAGLAARAVTSDGHTVDLTTMAEFDCSFYDGDVEVESGMRLISLLAAGKKLFADHPLGCTNELPALAIGVRVILLPL